MHFAKKVHNFFNIKTFCPIILPLPARISVQAPSLHSIRSGKCVLLIERTSLLGGEAGWRSDRSSYRGIERAKGLFYLLTLESICFVAAEDEDLTVTEDFLWCDAVYINILDSFTYKMKTCGKC